MRLINCLCVGATLLFIGISCQNKVFDPVQYVNPLIGSSDRISEGEGKRHDVDRGQTVPITGVPHGMTSWVPQTRATEIKCIAPYYYMDSKFQGFRASHWVNGGCTQDYGSVTIMPLCGKLSFDPESRASAFNHQNEVSQPDYYSVVLEKYSVFAEMTGLSRSSIQSFTFNADGDRFVVIEPNSDEKMAFISINTLDKEIAGYNPVHRIYNGIGKPAGFSGYFVIQFEDNVESMGIWCDSIEKPGVTSFQANGQKTGAFVKFKQSVKNAKVKIGTSFTSIEEARKNLSAEIPHWDFAKTREESHNIWRDKLSTIQITTEDTAELQQFYTALYSSCILPRTFSDVSGSYPMFATSYRNGLADDFVYYDDFSLWDTYRALHPLLTIISPKENNDMVRSMIIKGEQGGWLPIFPCWNSYTSAMIGDHGISIIADAYSKGQRNFDIKEAYRLMRKNAFEHNTNIESYEDGQGRRALDSYLQYGYIPIEDSVWASFHKREQVSRTLEYAYDDYALWIIAKELGHDDDAEQLLKRTQSYRNVYDSTSGFVRGRYADGSWYSPFDPYVTNLPNTRQRFITEGSPFQYMWYVPQDINGLISLLGSKEAFNNKLDTFFEDTHYWHGNEPSHHIAYLYAYSGEPWKTQALIPEIIKKQYHTGADGLCGNDDAGQMSAWLVFSSMGFYPVCPGSGEYIMGTPAFEKAALNLPNGKRFEITAKRNSKADIYIQSATLNGEEYTANFIKHSDIEAGGKLEFVMGDKPNTTRGTQPEDMPFSITKL